MRLRLLALLTVALAVTAAAATEFGAAFGPSWVGGPADRDESVVIRPNDPADLFENIGSRLDGAGMCVDTSAETQARLMGLERYRGFRDYWASVEGGGNTPSGLARQLAAWCRLKGMPAPEYVQYTGPDPVPILELCEKTGRGCCIAYGYSPRYGKAINHMVFCPHPRGPALAAVADNNVFGGLGRAEEKRYEWMDRDELVRRMKTQSDPWGRAVVSDAWVFTFCEPPPPPSPKPFPDA